MSVLSALGHLGLGKEATFGTTVVPTLFVPYDTIKVEDTFKKVTDSAHRGLLTKDYAVYNTTREASVEFESPAYPDILGLLLLGMFGQDTVTGTASPYTHKFTVKNGAAPTFTVSDYNGVSEREYSGAVIEEIGIKFDDADMLKVTTKMKSKASVTTTQASPTYGTVKPFLGFQASLKLNGASNVNMVGGEVTLKRASELIFTANNTQDPSKAVTGRIEATGKLTFDVEDETELQLFLNATQPTLDLTFTQDANTSLELSFGKIDISKATPDRSQEFLRVDLDFVALYNTTDAGLATFTLKNAVATY